MHEIGHILVARSIHYDYLFESPMNFSKNVKSKGQKGGLFRAAVALAQASPVLQAKSGRGVSFKTAIIAPLHN